MSKTLYGDGFIALGFKFLDCGKPDELHAVFDWAREHGAKPLKTPHPLNVHQRVLNGLDRDERFKKSYIHYTGIYKRPSRIFELKKVEDEKRGINNEKKS